MADDVDQAIADALVGVSVSLRQPGIPCPVQAWLTSILDELAAAATPIVAAVETGGAVHLPGRLVDFSVCA